MCGRDWKEHSSSTGGFYACNRFVPAAEGSAAGTTGTAGTAEPPSIRSFFSSLYGRMQVSMLAALPPTKLTSLFRGLLPPKASLCPSPVSQPVLRALRALWAGQAWWSSSAPGRSSVGCAAEQRSISAPSLIDTFSHDPKDYLPADQKLAIFLDPSSIPAVRSTRPSAEWCKICGPLLRRAAQKSSEAA